MKKIIIILFIFLVLPSYSKVFTGEIKKELRKDVNQVYDATTNNPIEGVLIKIPSQGFMTKTNKDGVFKLKSQIDSPTIMSLNKQGYKPFSLTLGNNINSPITIAIEKTTPKDIVIETDMIHIGDNSFSERSANANDFSSGASSSFYTKDFLIKMLKKEEEIFLVIGSIIGIDTIEAQRMGQSGVLTAYSSPPELFFNENKIAEIKINGDGQKIKIPKNLLKFNQKNNLTIKTGKNLYKSMSVDYDDIEFTNLFFEIK